MAFYSINAWRREFVGQRKITLAEDALAACYEARDAFRYIRNPTSFSYEREIEKHEAESDEQYTARQNAYVAFHRVEEKKEVFSRIHALRYRFAAQFGRSEAEPLEAMLEVRARVLNAANMLSRFWPRQSFRDHASLERHQKRVEKWEDVFWETDPETDEILVELDEALERLEITARRVIDGKGAISEIATTRV